MKRYVRTALLSLLLAGTPTAGLLRASGESATAGSAADVVIRESAEGIRPRLELLVPSVLRLLSEVHRSHAGVFADFASELMLEMSRSSSEGIGADEVLAIVAMVKSWPDTGVQAFIFAPDREGRARWAIRLDWPLEQLSSRLRGLLDLPAAKEVFSGIQTRDEDGVLHLRLGEEPLAAVYAAGPGRSVLASHADLPLPSSGSKPAAAADAQEEATGASGDDEEADAAETTPTAAAPAPAEALITCLLNLTKTEADSGATFLSSFQAVNGAEYSGYVNDKGDWVERVRIDWPPIAGIGAKVIFGRLQQTFFAPDSSFATMVFNASAAPGIIEQLAGLGPQMFLDEGELEAVADMSAGGLQQKLDDSMTMTILPGTGLFPAPDFVVQSRTKHPDATIELLRERCKKINEMHRERDLREPWKEVEVRGRPVFWSNAAASMSGTMMPFSMKPVLFLTKEADDRGRERDFVVAGWTTTSAESLVKRWVDLPRTKEFRHLPDRRKTNGQLWLNWKLLYGWAQPYVDLAISGASLPVLTPDRKKIEEHLTPAVLTAKLGYTNLTLAHEGPIPAAVLALPAMITTAAAADESGGSDLARERLASRRLKVLFHHCKLFHQDFGRWPAEVAELDGYVDFEGHPELLELELSSAKQWTDFFTDMFSFEEDKKSEDEEEDGLPTDIDDELYVIDWGREQWSLGYKPGTLEHLERLYVDQDGNLHRELKKKEPAAAASGDTPPASTEAPADVVPPAKEEE